MSSASALALFATWTSVWAKPPLPVTHFSGEVHRAISAVPGSVTLYDQNSDDNGVGILSQNFTDGSFQEYDSYAADDFAIPSGHKWKILE